MSDIIQVDVGMLEDHAHLHQQLAGWYREAASQVQHHGWNVQETFSQWKAQYSIMYHDHWINPSVEALLQLADLHEQWANFFWNYAAQVQRLDQMMARELSSPAEHQYRGTIAQ